MARSSPAATAEDALICLTLDSLNCAVATEQLELSKIHHPHRGTLVADVDGDPLSPEARRRRCSFAPSLARRCPTALQKLTGVNYRPVLDISSERYVWNVDGLVGDEWQAARPGQFNGVMLVGGRHIDALQGGNPLLQTSEYLIAGFSPPQNIEAVKILATGWVNDMFAGTHDGIYGAPQQSIAIDTSAGAARRLCFRSRRRRRCKPLRSTGCCLWSSTWPRTSSSMNRWPDGPAQLRHRQRRR
jgi:hypothetical protein